MKENRNIANSEIAMTSIYGRKQKIKKRKLLSMTSNNVLRGIIFSEILGKPKGRRELVSQNELKGFNSRR